MDNKTHMEELLVKSNLITLLSKELRKREAIENPKFSRRRIMMDKKDKVKAIRIFEELKVIVVEARAVSERMGIIVDAVKEIMEELEKE